MNIIILETNKDFSAKTKNHSLESIKPQKPLFIEEQLKKCEMIIDSKIFCIINENTYKKLNRPIFIEKLYPSINILKAPKQTFGSTCTSLLAIDIINNEEDLLIINCNNILDIDYNNVINEFKKQNLDAGVITFQSDNPNHTYIRIYNKKIIECSKKNKISDYAIFEFYWFQYGYDFVNAAQKTIKKDSHINGYFFISSTINELILNQKNIGYYRINSKNINTLNQ